MCAKVEEEAEQPNQQRTLNRLPPELRCKNYVIKHRPSVQVGSQTCKDAYMQSVRIPTELPFCTPPLLVGNTQPPTPQQVDGSEGPRSRTDKKRKREESPYGNTFSFFGHAHTHTHAFDVFKADIFGFSTTFFCTF